MLNVADQWKEYEELTTQELKLTEETRQTDLILEVYKNLLIQKKQIKTIRTDVIEENRN